MIEFLQSHIASERSNEGKINKLREILQLYVLKIVQDKGYFSSVAFVGGTALRILYDMRRFSEDLDFSLIDKTGYDFSDIVSALKREFELSGLKIEARTKTAKTVQGSMLKFPELLGALGLSSLRDQKLSIRIEIDSAPPAGWEVEKTLINKVYMLNITHFDLPSLYSTKIHACFFRKYTKGRDFYDFMWYLGKKIKPNYELLNNAIRQTEGRDPRLSSGNIKSFLLKMLAKVDLKMVKKDVERFLEDKSELKFLEQPVMIKAVNEAW